MQTRKVFIYFFILVIKENVLQGDANPLPLKNNILYESMISKCPEVKLIDDFNKQQVFDTCSNWTKNDENITTVTKINTTRALCTLYLNNFVTFCTHIREVKLNMSDARLKLIPDSVKTVDLQQEYNICKNLTKMTKFFSKHSCSKYCIDDSEAFSSQCVLAEYYASYDVSSLIQPKNSKSAVAEEKKSKQSALLDAVPALLSQVNIGPEKNTSSSGAVQQEKVTSKKVDNVSNQNQDNAAVNNEAVSAVEILAPGNDKKPELTPKLPQTNSVDVELGTIINNQTISQPKTNQTVKNLPEEQPIEDEHKPKKDQNENKAEDEEPPEAKTKQTKTIETAKPQIPMEQSSSTKGKSQTQGGISVQTKAPTQDNEKVNDFPFPNESAPQDDKQAQMENPALDDGLAQNDNEDVSPNEDDDNTDDTHYLDQNQPKKTTEEKSKAKPAQLDEDIPISSDDIDGESYFFSYFMVVCVLFVLGYVFYHNRTKVMALVIEGKRNRRQFRGRRPNSANYHKLDSNLEEAISSSCTKSKSNVIY